MDYIVLNNFIRNKSKLPSKKIVLLLDSFGGQAEPAYLLSRFLQSRCGSFQVVVPRWAKSAATLLALGAESIILGDEAELGPLDVQIWDYDNEEKRVSALDTVQAVEQLEDSAVRISMKMLGFLKEKTKKKYNNIMELSLKFGAELTKPLFEKIDSVAYTRHCRNLHEAQDYAERLLAHKFNKDEAAALAKDLVTKYPTHGFVIDREEAKSLGVIVDEKTGESKAPVGLHVIAPPNKDCQEAVEWFRRNMPTGALLGNLVEV